MSRHIYCSPPNSQMKSNTGNRQLNRLCAGLTDNQNIHGYINITLLGLTVDLDKMHPDQIFNLSFFKSSYVKCGLKYSLFLSPVKSLKKIPFA